MVAARKHIDIDDLPDLARIAAEVRRRGESVILRVSGEDAVLISPIESKGVSESREMTAADLEAFKASAGGWIGLVDVDEFLENNRRSRDLSFRPHVEL